jgi:uncharacterized protein YbaR (Trm112 family)
MSESSPQSSIPDDLLAILVCPIDHAAVLSDGDGLVCTHCGRRFPIENGIPDMVVEEDA